MIKRILVVGRPGSNTAELAEILRSSLDLERVEVLNDVKEIDKGIYLASADVAEELGKKYDMSELIIIYGIMSKRNRKFNYVEEGNNVEDFELIEQTTDAEYTAFEDHALDYKTIFVDLGTSHESLDIEVALDNIRRDDYDHIW